LIDEETYTCSHRITRVELEPKNLDSWQLDQADCFLQVFGSRNGFWLFNELEKVRDMKYPLLFLKGMVQKSLKGNN
jgi:hypothetical protein